MIGIIPAGKFFFFFFLSLVMIFLGIARDAWWFVIAGGLIIWSLDAAAHSKPQQFRTLIYMASASSAVAIVTMIG